MSPIKVSKRFPVGTKVVFTFTRVAITPGLEDGGYPQVGASGVVDELGGLTPDSVWVKFGTGQVCECDPAWLRVKASA